MENNLELARTKLTVRHLAQHSELAEAESLLHALRETVTFLERRLAREKAADKKSGDILPEDMDRIKELLTTRNGKGPQVAFDKGRWWYAEK